MNFQQLTKAHHLRVYNRYPITLVKGESAYVWDEDGNKYFDALAGIAVNSLGIVIRGLWTLFKNKQLS